MVVVTTPTRSGLDLRWVDAAVRPQDDLFAHLNGVYLREHEMPADRAQDGAFRDLRDRAEADVRAIVEEAASAPGDDARKIAALYASFMDVDRVEELGTAPLQPLLDEVATAPDRAALAAVLGRRQRQGRVSLFGTYVSTDAKNSDRYLVHLSQSGLGLPDESYYRDDAYAEIRTAYVAHLARLAELVGLDDPTALAEQVMDLETALAKVSWDRVTNRDAEKTYTLMTLPALQTNAPGFDWEPWLAALQAPDGALSEIVVRQPAFVAAAAALWMERPIRNSFGVIRRTMPGAIESPRRCTPSAPLASATSRRSFTMTRVLVSRVIATMDVVRSVRSRASRSRSRTMMPSSRA